MQHKTCSRCFTDFSCGSQEASCWCMAYPTVAVVEGQDCLCETCLQQSLQSILRSSKETPNLETEDYYIENGLYVFTPNYHLKRGTCCKNGCRHCPYGYKKI